MTLERRLGPFDAAAIVVANVIGGGIFYIPAIVAGLVSSGAGIIGVWAFGGLLAFAGAMAYAELATLRPHSGGEYVYLRDAYGPMAAFLTGWTSFVAGFSGAIAASAVVLSEYIGRFVPFAADKTPWFTVPVPYVNLFVTPQSLIAIVAIVALSFVHLHGSGRVVHNVLAGAKVSALLVFIALGFGWGTGSLGHLAGAQATPVPAMGWLLAMVPIMFTYSGWNAAAYVAEEIRNPGRNVPLALGLGTIGVVAIYLALNVLYLYAMPIGDLAAVSPGQLTAKVAEHLFGFVAGSVIAIFTIVSIAASISAMVMAGPRVYYAMARDHLFLESAAKIHPRYRTPVRAIFAQAAWSSILVLSGSLPKLVEYTGFAVVLFSGFAVLAVFTLRHREPAAERPFRALGYPLAPGFFIVASAAMVIYALVKNPGPTLAGLAVIGAGAPVYWLFTWRSRRKV